MAEIWSQPPQESLCSAFKYSYLSVKRTFDTRTSPPSPVVRTWIDGTMVYGGTHRSRAKRSPRKAGGSQTATECTSRPNQPGGQPSCLTPHASTATKIRWPVFVRVIRSLGGGGRAADQSQTTFKETRSFSVADKLDSTAAPVQHGGPGHPPSSLNMPC